MSNESKPVTGALKREFAGFRDIRTVVIIGICFIAAAVLGIFCRGLQGGTDYGIVSLVPAVFLVIYIFSTKRVVEALVVASVVGLLIVSPETFVSNFSETMTGVMMDEDTGWLIIVCGLLGSIMKLIEHAGGAFCFGEWVAKRARTRKSALMWTWVLGVIIFMDDYLNSLTVGSCMSSVTDKYKVSREFLSYVVSSTAAPLCVLIPVSTWAVFAGRIMVASGWSETGASEVQMFIKTIPFNFYGWVAAIMVPLVIYGVIPIFGTMKAAEDRVKNGGPLAPPGSEKIDMHAGEKVKIPENASIWNFFLPIAVLIGVTVASGCDMQVGVFATMAFLFVSFLVQGICNAEEFIDISMEGFKNMMLPLLLMVLAFLFASMNEQIGFTYYLITTASKIMTPQLLPVIVFIILACTEFITGTNWGMYIIALPIVIPLAEQLGCNMPLAVAAVLSAGVFGSHVCFYSDCTVITSSATGCDNFAHAKTQATYGVLAAVVSAILYVIAGFVFN